MSTVVGRRQFLAAAGAVPLLVAAAGPASASTGLRGRFSHPTRVTNPFFPMVVGTEFSYAGVVDAGGVSLPHEVVFTVTDLVKEIHGIETVVAWDRDFIDHQLSEAELAFFAQDDAGNVWNVGEYPEEFDNGVFAGAPSTWIDGALDSRGGLHMLAHPKVGAATYTEGHTPSIGFFDRSKVLHAGRTVTVPAGRYHGVLEVDEWSPNDPASGHQRKFYAPGVGLVRIAAAGGNSQEFLNLTRVRRVGAKDLATARTASRAMDRRAYRVAPGMWSHTDPVERVPHDD
jgi:hypothetical protein